MSKPKPPCYHCERRHVDKYTNCHSNCKEYADYCKLNAQRNAEIRAEKARGAEIAEYIAKSKRRHGHNSRNSAWHKWG